MGKPDRPHPHRSRGTGLRQNLLRTARADGPARRLALHRRLAGLQIPGPARDRPARTRPRYDAPPNDGTTHFKYIPKTGDWGTADVAYPVFTPATGSNERVLEHWSGQSCIQFHRAAWEDMPTQYNIVNAFAALPIVEYRDASVTKSVGAKDLSDQRMLR